VTVDVVEKSITAGKPLDKEASELLAEVKSADLNKDSGKEVTVVDG
jgi:hypothetical protein